jgi:hypothetical protein
MCCACVCVTELLQNLHSVRGLQQETFKKEVGKGVLSASAPSEIWFMLSRALWAEEKGSRACSFTSLPNLLRSCAFSCVIQRGERRGRGGGCVREKKWMRTM